MLLQTEGERTAKLYTLELRANLDASEPMGTTAWRTRRLAVNPAGPSGRPDRVWMAGGDVVAARWEGNALGLEVLRASGPFELPPLEGVTKDYEACAISGSGVLAVLWEGGGGGEVGVKSQSGASYQLREVSVTTGRTLYAGGVDNRGPLSVREFQILAGLLVLVFALVIVFVLRTDVASVPVLPAGVVLAEPLRRLTAFMLDYLPAAVLTASVFGLAPLALVDLGTLASGSAGLWHVLVALGVGCVHSTIGEAVFGRSLGKWLTGCEVVRVVKMGEKGELIVGRLGWGRAIVRNLVRWALPPGAMFLLFDGARRHAGDVLGKSLVVTPAPQEVEDH